MELTLRPLRIQDAVRLAKLADNEKVHRYLRDRFPSPYGAEHALSYIQCCSDNEADGMAMVRAIIADGTLAGVLECVFHIDIDSRNGDIGYWLGEPFWGRGLAADALRLFCSEIFRTHPEIWRLSASVLEPNHASLRAIEKAGFVREAKLCQAAYKFETLMDVYVYALLRSDWQRLVVNVDKTGIIEKQLCDLTRPD